MERYLIDYAIFMLLLVVRHFAGVSLDRPGGMPYSCLVLEGCHG